jgi:AAA ATPase domain
VDPPPSPGPPATRIEALRLDLAHPRAWSSARVVRLGALSSHAAGAARISSAEPSPDRCVYHPKRALQAWVRRVPISKGRVASLQAAHRGYEYQDLLSAGRAVDLLLESLRSVDVDRKMVEDDRFDDLSTVDTLDRHQRVQFKHRDNDDRPLPLDTFVTDGRKLRLDRLVRCAIAYRDGPGKQARKVEFRIVLRDAAPVDPLLTRVLTAARPDPGPFLQTLISTRLKFSVAELWAAASEAQQAAKPAPGFGFLHATDTGIEFEDLAWVCDRLLVEVGAPAYSADLRVPGPAEQLVLNRVRFDVGAESYPNENRSAVDVAEAMVRTVRAARQGRGVVTGPELIRRTDLRQDFGAVARLSPVQPSLEVRRESTVAALSEAASDGAIRGVPVLVTGPPGHGKTWACQQLLGSLAKRGWLVAEHYCYLGLEGDERVPRVMAETVFGSLLHRLAEADPSLVAEQRPRFAADAQALRDALIRAQSSNPNRPIALVVDGLDHVARVRGIVGESDPSRALAEELADLDLPPGSVLIVLSQPGEHLRPLLEMDASTFNLPGLTRTEIRSLAARLGVVGDGSQPAASMDRDTQAIFPLEDEQLAGEFIEVLAERSRGNSLYATYLTREVLREPLAAASPISTVRSLPQFDGSLQAYYEYVVATLGDAAWVADVLALIDFSVTRSELREIYPTLGHRVDAAIDRLAPVLSERAALGGLRIYHESFARFLQQAIRGDGVALIALLDLVAEWLHKKGPEDERHFRFLLPTLAAAGRDREVVALMDLDYVARAVALGYPASAIRANLVAIVASAAKADDWPAMVRAVELSRAAEAFEFERLDNLLVEYAIVPMSELGGQRFANRLLHEDRPVMQARAGLQLCAAVDALGARAPWREYMDAYTRERKADNTSYGADSDRRVALAWVRGRLRLTADSLGLPDTVSATSEDPPSPARRASEPSAGDQGTREFDAQNVALEQTRSPSSVWKRLAALIDSSHLPAGPVLDAICDTFGLTNAHLLDEHFRRDGAYALAVAERLTASEASSCQVAATRWAEHAVELGIPEGNVHRLFRLGIPTDKLNLPDAQAVRNKLLSLTSLIQEETYISDPIAVREWLDSCAIAVRRDALAVSAAEASISGEGWYRCWLRFALGLVRAEAATTSDRPRLAIEALRELTGDLRPFAGQPRSSDLYQIHPEIRDTIKRAVVMLSDETWSEGFRVLQQVTGNISTTIYGESGGPLPTITLLQLAVEAAETPHRRQQAKTLIRESMQSAAGGRFYSDIAEFELIAAMLAVNENDSDSVRWHWLEAARLFTAYGWRKDITIYELLDPLEHLISADLGRARVRLSQIQSLCNRVVNHTDGRETRHAPYRWWRLLTEADPLSAARLAVPEMLSEANLPRPLFDATMNALWAQWWNAADPVVSSVMRLSIDTTLCEMDADLLPRVSGAATHELPVELATLVLARTDERALKHPVSNTAELEAEDRSRVERLNGLLESLRLPRVVEIPDCPVAEATPIFENIPTSTQPVEGARLRIDSRVTRSVAPGAVGLAQALRTWRRRPYEANDWRWDVDRFASLVGYRLVELAEAGREAEAESALRALAEDVGYEREKQKLIEALATGLEHNGQTRLAAMAYALAWTSARGHGGWLTFGGETDLQLLGRGLVLDPVVVRTIVAHEVQRSIGSRGTWGVAQALVIASARLGLHVPGITAADLAFSMWDAAADVISARAPRVHPSDDAEPAYSPPETDEPIDSTNVELAFALATLGGVSHASRETKRRSLLGLQILQAERPTLLGTALEFALGSLSDSTSVAWILRVLLDGGFDKSTGIEFCRNTLMTLSGSPFISVRSLARQLIGGKAALPPPDPPDRELLPSTYATGLWIPGRAAPRSGNNADPEIQGLLAYVAGDRLSIAQAHLPGVFEAAAARLAVTINSAPYKKRLEDQRSFADRLSKRIPDAHMAVEEAVEDAIQRAAGGGRGARLLAGDPVADPAAWELALGDAIVVDPLVPLRFERARQPRPDIPPPPCPGDALWLGTAPYDGDLVVPEWQGGARRQQEASPIAGVTGSFDPNEIDTVRAGRFAEWRMIATAEDRTFPGRVARDDPDRIASRYRSVDLTRATQRQEAIGRGSAELWWDAEAEDRFEEDEGTARLINVDRELRALADVKFGLRVEQPILVPSPLLLRLLNLRLVKPLAFGDADGPGLALVIWRAEYQTSEYHLPWPRLRGCGVLLRPDLFLELQESTSRPVRFQDFILGYGMEDSQATHAGAGVYRP